MADSFNPDELNPLAQGVYRWAQTQPAGQPAASPAPAPQPDFRDYLQERNISLWDIDAAAQAGQDFAAGRPANPGITNPTTGAPASTDPGAQGAAATTVANQWTEQSNALMQQLLTNQQAAQAQTDERGSALYDTLDQRATQGLDVSRQDPIIRAQADAYAAAQERARRDHLADVAERSGPYGNLRGEQRLGYERAGQAVGAFEAELMGRELQTRRDEIAQALQMQAGLLSGDQQRALQMQLAALDAAIQQQSVGSQDAQFWARLGLDAETQAAYFDAVRRGLFKQ
jgi:hypothetical protein